jgi:predicted sulfurtransferase
MGHFMAQYDGKDEKVTSLKDKNIVVYCQGGVRSQIVAEAIKKVRKAESLVRMEHFWFTLLL